MANYKFTTQNIIYNILLTVTIVQCSKLNVPRVLLPIFTDFSTKFTLEVTEGGCYKWTTTRADIIKIETEDQNSNVDCSTKVVISTVTKEDARSIAVVLAEDVHTKQVLRCDVIVDFIDSLGLSTTTRELFMDEAPESFEVIAYDSQGNAFSSLDGVEFEWTIVSSGPNKETILRYITFRDSLYETTTAITELENENKKGYIILLEGVKSGSAKVSVRLPQSEYSKVPAFEVQLMVVANLVLTPHEVYVMPGDVVTFKMYSIINGKMDPIPFPDSQYYIESDNQNVASSVKQSGSVTAMKEGNSKVYLKDRNVESDDSIRLPFSNIHVVSPDYLVINVLPHKNYAILVGDIHDLQIEIYSQDDHKLFIGEGVNIIFDIGPDFFVNTRTSNGSWASGYGIKPSTIPLQATLKSVYSESAGKIALKKPIVGKGELLVYPRISISPPEVILPWDPLVQPKYDVVLEAKGGDGKFLWSSTDNSIGVVSQNGHVHTHASGYFEISAAMFRNHHNREISKFMILPPTRLEIVEFLMEAEVGSPVYLHLALYAEQIGKDGNKFQIPFTKCQDLPFQIKQSDAKFRHNRTASVPAVGISCGNIAMVGLNVGTSKITVTYYHDGRALEDSVTISAFKPLVLIEPKTDIILAVGTSINLIFQGGPRPVIGRSSDFQKVVVSDNENKVQARDITDLHVLPSEDMTVVEVLCKELGDTDIKLMISNSPSAQNCKSQSSNIAVRITCGKPRKVTLQPELQIADPTACPMDLSASSVVVQASKSINLDVAVFDDCGNRFLNISSLELFWEINPIKAAAFLSKDSVFTNDIVIGTVNVSHKAYQIIKPTAPSATSLVVTVTIEQYKESVLKVNKISSEFPPFLTDSDSELQLPPLFASITLYLVDDSLISPTELLLYNHPGNKRMLAVQQGSGYFELVLSNEDVATVQYKESSHEIEVIPIRSGELTVQLNDLCLVTKPASLVIRVVSVGIIRVDMPDKVEIGKCILSIVKLYDENDNLMVIPDPDMIDLRPMFDNNIANIHRKDVEESAWGHGEIHFIVSGVAIGNTKLTFKVTNNEEDITSAPIDIQVFQALKLHPRNGTVLIGSKFQFDVKGGPQPDNNIMFSSTNNFIIEVDPKGIVSGKHIGSTKIHARAIGTHPTTGDTVVYSEDTVEISVIELTDIKIAAPLMRFQVGATVPLWCYGVPDISPLILASVEDPHITFKWRVEDNILIDLHQLFQIMGISYHRSGKLSMKATGLQPGKTRITVEALVSGITANKPNVVSVTLSSYVDVEVLPSFYLVEPKTIKGTHLLMAPFSSIQLSTNLDISTSIVTYKLLRDTAARNTMNGTSVASTGESVVSLTETGLVQSFGVIGNALIIIMAEDEFGMTQKIEVAVEIKEIYYMMASIRSNWRIHPASTVNTVPLGTKFVIVGSFHDNLGNQFHSGPEAIKVRTTRCDLVKLQNGSDPATLLVHTTKAGYTSLKIWADGIKKTATYLKLNVQQSVSPVLEDLTTGDIVCMWTPVVTEFNVPGHWRSNDPSLIKINPILDIGFVGEKEGLVVLTHTLLPAAPIYIKILPIYKIEFLSHSNVKLTNGQIHSLVRFPLVLQSAKSFGIKTNNLIQGWRCRTDVRTLVRPKGFKCFFELSIKEEQVFADELFNITTSWVPDSGQFACKIINKGVSGPNISTIHSHVIIWATTEDEEVISKKLDVKFIPGFYVPDEITLQPNSNSAILNVIGLSEVLRQVTVEPADKSIIYVDKGTQVDETTLRYNVKLIDYHWRLGNLPEAMGINVKCALTKQDVKVMLKVTSAVERQVCSMRGSPLSMFLQNYSHVFIMIIAALFIFFLTFYFYSNYMQPVVHVNVNRSALAQTSNISPPRCLGALYATQLNNSSATTSPNLSHRANCSTNRCYCTNSNPNTSLNSSREPIYGDASSFYNSDVRRNRRCM